MSGADSEARAELAQERLLPSERPIFLSDALRFDLLHAPGHLLRRNHQRSYELFAQRVGDRVTRQQAAMMIALARCPGQSQNELVSATGMDKSTLKELLGRMAARELVVRSRHPADSRAWTFHLALEGERLLAELMPRIAAAQRDILAPATRSATKAVYPDDARSGGV